MKTIELTDAEILEISISLIARREQLEAMMKRDANEPGQIAYWKQQMTAAKSAYAKVVADYTP